MSDKLVWEPIPGSEWSRLISAPTRRQHMQLTDASMTTIRLALEYKKASILHLPHSLEAEEATSMITDIDAALAELLDADYDVADDIAILDAAIAGQDAGTP